MEPQSANASESIDSINAIIAAWLNEHNGSSRTYATYAHILTAFRAFVLANGNDLFGEPHIIASLAQDWASRRKLHPKHQPSERPLTAATYNHSLSVLSSFYVYALRHGCWKGTNPLYFVERRTVAPYATLQVLDPSQIGQAIQSIARTRLKDLRDYALITLAFSTGLRVSSIAKMTLGDIRWQPIKIGRQSRRTIVMDFEMRRGKTLSIALEPEIAVALDAYLTCLYGEQWMHAQSDAPVWVTCSRNTHIRGQSLRPVGIAYIFHQRLGPTVHPAQVRHSFAALMGERQAQLTVIQQRLEHARLTTNMRHMIHFRADANPYISVVRRLNLTPSHSVVALNDTNVASHHRACPQMSAPYPVATPSTPEVIPEIGSPSFSEAGTSSGAEGRIQQFDTLIGQIQTCTSCPRMADRARVFGKGNGQPQSRILFLAEAPGRLGADRWHIPLYGDQTGRNFERFLTAAGLTRDDIFISNAVLCNPRDEAGNNAVPAKVELQNCSHHLRATLSLLQPRYVVTLGKVALTALNLITPHSVDLAHDVGHPLDWNDTILIPLYHPGPRACIHRPLEQQLRDYEAVGQIVRGSLRD